jgi:hypothetical protein
MGEEPASVFSVRAVAIASQMKRAFDESFEHGGSPFTGTSTKYELHIAPGRRPRALILIDSREEPRRGLRLVAENALRCENDFSVCGIFVAEEA